MQIQSFSQPRNFFAIAALFLVSGCGDDVTHLPATGTPGTPIDTGLPPLAPTDAAMPDGPGATFAVSSWNLGGFNSAGGRDTNLWKTMGYNLDHTVTTKTSAGVIIGDNVCAHVAGASFSEIADGNAGRDNGFGLAVLPLMLAANGLAEKATNDLVLNGHYSLLIDVPGLGDSRTYQSLTAQLYEVRAFVDAQGNPAKPNFDGNDIWPIDPESVVDGAPDKPLVTAMNAYVADEGDGGTFVGQFGETIRLSVDVLGAENEKGVMQIRIHEPLVTMRLSADRSRVESGTLAGYIDTAALEAEVVRLVGIIDNSLCNSVTSESIRAQIHRSSDILRNGLKDPSKPCEAISLGIQFEATRANLGKLTDPAAPLQNPCPTP